MLTYEDSKVARDFRWNSGEFDFTDTDQVRTLRTQVGAIIDEMERTREMLAHYRVVLADTVLQNR